MLHDSPAHSGRHAQSPGLISPRDRQPRRRGARHGRDRASGAGRAIASPAAAAAGVSRQRRGLDGRHGDRIARGRGRGRPRRLAKNDGAADGEPKHVACASQSPITKS